METVKVSASYRVAIPKSIWDEVALLPGEKLLVYVQDGAVCLRRPSAIEKLLGVAKGMNWKADYRERRDRF